MVYFLTLAREILVNLMKSQISLIYFLLISKFFSKPVWLGLNEVNQDDWRWEDGSSPTFDFWAYGEPNDHGGNDEKCAVMNISPSQEGFYDFPCEANLGFICKF